MATTKAFHSVTSVLIINLAVSDLLVGAGVMPFVALSVLNHRWVDCTVRLRCATFKTVYEPECGRHYSSWCLISCATGPLFICGLHLLGLLHSICADLGCDRSGPLPFHHGLSALQLPLHPVAGLCCGAVDLAAGSGHQLPPTSRLELHQLRGPHVQLCSRLGQHSRLHGLCGCALLPHPCIDHPLLLCEHHESGSEPCQKDPHPGGLCPAQQESELWISFQFISSVL